ncbi:PaaI family thioesterase [Jeotgalibacillus marinus]|uniref:PaaI family thioesterase n=1 Tax=Jeotgalibacillus marinus TaxID=86667 RepID=A0ABV3Q451_9BACL
MMIEEIKKEFEECPYLQHLGIKILAFEEENVEIKLSLQQYLLNTKRTLHGGVHASMMGFIQSMHLRSVTRTRCIATSSTVHFTAPVKTGDIYAKASIISRGYKTAFVDSIVRDEEGDIVSKGTGTYKIIRE